MTFIPVIAFLVFPVHDYVSIVIQSHAIIAHVILKNFIT